MKTAKKISLPAAVAQFVEQQKTISLDELCDQSLPVGFPYAEYWRRAIACMMLSGRVQPKGDGTANGTDVTRICKEANFNQYLFEKVGLFLVKADIVDPGKYGSKRYHPGKNLAGFWDHDVDVLAEAARGSFLKLLQDFTGYKIHRPTTVHSSALDEFTAIFAAAFQGLALNVEDVGKVLLEFSQLPEDALKLTYKRLNLDKEKPTRMGWDSWFDEKGQEAFLSTLYACEWAYGADHQNKRWIYVNDIARVLLGLHRAPKPEPLPVDLKVLPDFSVFAGAGLPLKTLLPLFRYCKIKRIDQVFEFQFNSKRFKELADKEVAVKELRAGLAAVGELPKTVESLFSDKPPARGRVQLRSCCAILKPENAEVLTAIREHRRLKGYLEAGAPPGYLLIKYGSNPANFVDRCGELGFTIDIV